MAEMGSHNVARCDFVGVESNDLVDSPFRRDGKMPSATERYLAIQDHKNQRALLFQALSTVPSQCEIAKRDGKVFCNTRL